jgi:RecA-family ATPase
MELPERIRAYVDACPPAISGQGGHNQTFGLACSLINGFALSEAEALHYLTQFNQRCQPPWTERELIHKIKSALNTVHEKPRGHLVGEKVTPAYIPKATLSKPTTPIPVAPDNNSPVPSPLSSPTTALLLVAFQKNEGVSVCPVAINKAGHTIPQGSGTVYERDALIALLEQQGGDPNKLIPCQHGAYLRINPMEIGQKSDTDQHVTAFRHVLVEFDSADRQKQWLTIIQSGAPCTAVLTSGGKSLHAWIRVEAKDLSQYNERRDSVYAYFVPLGADPKNRNPSRYSRLPGMKRGEKYQELLAINIGASSYEQWMIDRAAAGIGTQFTIKSLIDFKPDQDPACVIGKRYLCKGGSCLIFGQTHAGKSSFGLQMAVVFALNGDFFGIAPIRGLKSVYVQAENDVGDMSEMLVGILKGLNLWTTDPIANANLLKTLQENLIIIRDQSNTGLEFASATRKLIAKHQPDLFWIDPLLSFYGADISDQKQCSQFLRSWLNPISEATGVIWMVLHHTGKPMKDAGKITKAWTSTDFAYQSLGSSELSNWARAIISIIKTSEDEFRVILAKRGWRSGALDTDGSITNELFLAHSTDSICWRQIPKPSNNGTFDNQCRAFAASIFEPLRATEIITLAEKALKRGNRTLWKLWDKGNGPLAEHFIKFDNNLYRPVHTKFAQPYPD